MQCPNNLCRATFVVPVPPAEPPEVIDAELADDSRADLSGARASLPDRFAARSPTWRPPGARHDPD